MAKNVKETSKPSSNVINDIKNFGKHLKYKRTSQGLTLVEAAQLCNINNTTLIRLEKGSEGVRLSTALHVAKMFGLKLILE
ncbi:MAG: helix-turn-helix transcriptional regulator [Arcobacter sp.]|jgi:DNA-binding XRE family transcriptional regulator|uniref:helix-turn-helix domain-containing protein n=1 Tax=Arcobacter sp. TaxID=1872629 RepID=UPI002A766012|nr:helix-turn-helix transcriptional regulator [Arcobacter sp.]MDY3205047.1 helix-turn-helix transcriptional regulator [Arcobacter sp.]